MIKFGHISTNINDNYIIPKERGYVCLFPLNEIYFEEVIFMVRSYEDQRSYEDLYLYTIDIPQNEIITYGTGIFKPKKYITARKAMRLSLDIKIKGYGFEHWEIQVPRILKIISKKLIVKAFDKRVFSIEYINKNIINNKRKI